MEQEIKDIVFTYWKGGFSQEEFQRSIKNTIGASKEDIEQLFQKVITAKDAEGVECGISIICGLGMNTELIHIYHTLILEPWHTRYEDIIHILQDLKNPSSIPFITKAMQTRYKYLDSYGTGTSQFINQCGHALWSIGTPEALEVIKELSRSEDPILKDEMLYRISRIEGRDDYERSFD